ncbi:MAG TPA: aspartyl/asparaginyl beta-hydroxylase domain-containing protein [Labilithrix sp.]|nr:aspartyl/asparaginyl beta-hydroxylase domain-containing protein [Labilithrix sp.]
MRRDADQFPRHLWSPDRLSGGVPGAYTTLALVAHRGRENDEMFGPFAPTPFLAACPYLRQVISWFDAPVCEVRLRWLGPRAFAAFHFDRHRLLEDRYRIHVPIHTTPHAHFYCADRVAEMTAGSAWTFDRMRRHAVFNDDPAIHRLHLIMDFRPSDKLRRVVERAAETLDDDDLPLVPFDESAEPRLAFERECPPAVWSPARLRTELSALRGRFADDSRFTAMAPETQKLLKGWSAVWQLHRSARSGWPAYQKLARSYYAAWRTLCPIRDVADERSETSWIACLLDTGAYVPSRARVKPSWSPNEVLELVDTVRITIGKGGAARISVDGDDWRPIPASAVCALLEVVRGGSPKALRATLGKKRYDEASPTLRWLAEEGALRVADDAYQLGLLFGPPEKAALGGDLVVPPATMTRLVSLRERLGRSSRFRAAAELHFILKPSGAVGAYLPHVDGYDMLFPDALAIAQHMALGLSVDEIAEATGYGSTDDFLLFVAWLWDVLPLTCEGDAPFCKPAFVQRLDRGETITLPTLSSLDPVSTVTALAAIGASTVILDTSGPCSPASIRRAVATARIKHVDVLVKTSARTGVAALRDLPVAGFVLADCDAAMLQDVEHALADRAHSRPFVLAVVESIHAIAELESIGRSPWVDALVVGGGDLGRNARLYGVDPVKTVVRATRGVRRIAARNGKRWAVVADSAEAEARAREEGATLILRGTDVTLVGDGIRSLTALAKPSRRHAHRAR